MAFFVGPFVVGPARGKAFPAEFMEQFKEEHQKAFGEGSAPIAGGFPDCGDGRFSDKLEYKKWVEDSNAHRAQRNAVEQLPMQVVFLLVEGLFFPILTVFVSWLLVGARLIYIISYVKSGSDARRFGAQIGGIPLNLLALATLGCSIYSACKE